jgi:hypothetical protein
MPRSVKHNVLMIKLNLHAFLLINHHLNRNAI